MLTPSEKVNANSVVRVGFFNKKKFATVRNDWEESRDDFVSGPPFEKMGQSSQVYGSELKEIIKK